MSKKSSNKQSLRSKDLNTTQNSIMEKLLASSNKVVNLRRGQEVEGEVVSKNNKEIILDLGAKSEAVLSCREIPKDKLETLKLGDKLKAFVVLTENDSGQVVLSSHQAPLKLNQYSKGRSSIPWQKFIQTKDQNSKLSGKVLEVNKGGLIIDVLGTRGFLPNSQVGVELLSKASKGMEDLVGENLTVTVIEIDVSNNRLIFSQRNQVPDEVLTRLKKFKRDQKVSGKIVAILPFGLVVSVKDRSASGGDVEGLVFISDVSWEKLEDLTAKFKVGQEVEVLVLGLDEELGRLNLSIKQLLEDPFKKMSQDYQPDDLVKGEVLSVTDAGVTIKLEGGLEGLLPISKMDQTTTYQAGESVTVLIDSVDAQKRKITFAPMVTSTAGLIYK